MKRELTSNAELGKHQIIKQEKYGHFKPDNFALLNPRRVSFE